MTTASSPDRQFTIARTFNAPRELVFRMWTSEEHVRWWWGPRQFALTVHAMDVRPGGEWRYTMHAPDGTDYPGVVTYRIVDPPARLAYAHDRPRVDVDITFAEQGGTTLVSTTMTRTEPVDPIDAMAWGGAREGITQTFARLDERLADYAASTTGDPTIVMSREFDAPRALVWRAYTEPKHFGAWWGPHGYVNETVEMDVRPGGAWRVVQRARDGEHYTFGGVYRDVVAPERIVGTFVWDGNPDEELVMVTTLEDLGGARTRVTATTTFPSLQARDTFMGYGAIGGASQGYERLRTVLDDLR